MLKILFAMLFIIHALPAQEKNDRRIWLFGSSSADTMLQRQLKILQADPKGLAERDLVITVITPSSDSTRYFGVMKSKEIFLLQLYGRDGGLKFSAAKPISRKQLYGIIDAMPMRKEELKQQPGKQAGL